MIRTSHWQCRYEGFDYSDFAQEFLRRNPEYRAEFVRLHNGNNGATQSLAARRRARSWGLEFSSRSRPGSRYLPGILARRSQSQCHPGRTLGDA